MRNLVFVDCEARGESVVNGTLTEFGAVHFGTRRIFHGKIFDSVPDPAGAAVPLVGERLRPSVVVAREFRDWLTTVVGGARPVFMSDNPAYDWQWIAALFDEAGVPNPFGHSARRIGDFYAGLTADFGNTQRWKQWRVTPHTHNPVDDAMGNAEAFERVMELCRAERRPRG